MVLLEEKIDKTKVVKCYGKKSVFVNSCILKDTVIIKTLSFKDTAIIKTLN